LNNSSPLLLQQRTLCDALGMSASGVNTGSSTL
jgi:hypothetical protein